MTTHARSLPAPHLVLFTTVLLLTLLTATPLAHASASLAEASSAAAAATNEHSRAASALGHLDARIATSRARLAVLESGLPATAAEEVAAMATAFGGAFSPALAGRSRALAEDRSEREQLLADVAALTAERQRMLIQVTDAQRRQELTSIVLEEAKLMEAARVRAERLAAFGHFPVVGPNEYIDSWGFARSGGRRHRGSDIFAERGTPVVAVRDGWAVPGHNRLGGLVVWLHADDGKRYYYAHLDGIAIGEGRVTGGQVLGTLGDTGNAKGTPPHLHFEIHEPDAVNPYEALNQMVR